MDYYHPLAWDLDPTISSLSNGNESFSHSIACYTGVCSVFSAERDIWIVGSHVLTWFYFEGHHIIMVIHRSKLCKIKARYAGLSPHAPLTRRPLCWWRVPLSSLLSPLWLWTPGVTGCCHHTSAARSDLSPSFLILCNIIQRLTYNNLQPFRQFIDVITITSSIQQT